jgi:hypothetical protein
MRCGIATPQAEVEKPNGQASNPAIRCEARAPWRQQRTRHDEHVLTRVGRRESGGSSRGNKGSGRSAETSGAAAEPPDLADWRGYRRYRRRAGHRHRRRCSQVHQASNRSARRPVDCGSGRAGLLRCPRPERPAAHGHIRGAGRLPIQACLAPAITCQDHANHRPGPQAPPTPVRPTNPIRRARFVRRDRQDWRDGRGNLADLGDWVTR